MVRNFMDVIFWSVTTIGERQITAKSRRSAENSLAGAAKVRTQSLSLSLIRVFTAA
jgi:hypothetical protein